MLLTHRLRSVSSLKTTSTTATATTTAASLRSPPSSRLLFGASSTRRRLPSCTAAAAFHRVNDDDYYRYYSSSGSMVHPKRKHHKHRPAGTSSLRLCLSSSASSSSLSSSSEQDEQQEQEQQTGTDNDSGAVVGNVAKDDGDNDDAAAAVAGSSSLPPTLKIHKSRRMSYEVDSDEDAEQHMGNHTVSFAAAPEAAAESTTVVVEDSASSAFASASASAAAAADDDDDGTASTKKEEESAPPPPRHEPVSSGSDGRAKTGRYDELLSDVGLSDDADLMSAVRRLSDRRSVSTRGVYCNRELKLSGIRAVGFDMDYTLAQYRQPAFDRLAFDGAKRKLVENFGYPAAVLDFEYDHEFWTRGLIMDTLRGNFLKIDRHKYVRVAYHGFDCISSTTRKLLYSRTFNKVMSFSEKHFVNMDTLFQFVDAHLFANLIQLKDAGGVGAGDGVVAVDDAESSFLDYKTYQEMYKDVRECVDLCHRDGVIKDEVAADPAEYIVRDPGLVPMLNRYREAGVKVFLLTNSLWEYTSVAMNYLYHGAAVDDDCSRRNEWMELFDLIVVGSCKPAYMVDPYLNLFRVDPVTGSLRNTDGVYEIEALGESGASKFLAAGKTFQGGNWLHLHAMLETRAGEEILYVGDHLYSDVLRSKRTLGWRSAFVMPELEQEMKTFYRHRDAARKIASLRRLRDELSDAAEELRNKNMLRTTTTRTQQQDDKDDDDEATLKKLKSHDRLLKEKLSELACRWHAAFHPVWGAMFNAGYQDSRFAFYVENYACVYTSRATNLGLASTDHSFRTGNLEMLPHDKLAAAADSVLRDADPWKSVRFLSIDDDDDEQQQQQRREERT